MFMIVPHWLNLRYGSPTDAPICLLAAVALRALFLAARQLLRRELFYVLATASAAVIALSLIADYQRFPSGFLDLSVKQVLAASRK
jgi:hypothetical protein